METDDDDVVRGYRRTTGTFAGRERTFWVNEKTGKSVWVLPPIEILDSLEPSTGVIRHAPGTLEAHVHVGERDITQHKKHR